MPDAALAVHQTEWNTNLLTGDKDSTNAAPCRAGAPLFPLVHLLPHLFPLFTFLFLSLALPIFFFCPSIPSLSTRIVPLRFQAGDRRRRPTQGLVLCVPSVL